MSSQKVVIKSITDAVNKSFAASQKKVISSQKKVYRHMLKQLARRITRRLNNNNRPVRKVIRKPSQPRQKSLLQTFAHYFPKNKQTVVKTLKVKTPKVKTPKVKYTGPKVYKNDIYFGIEEIEIWRDITWSLAQYVEIDQQVDQVSSGQIKYECYTDSEFEFQVVEPKTYVDDVSDVESVKSEESDKPQKIEKSDQSCGSIEDLSEQSPDEPDAVLSDVQSDNEEDISAILAEAYGKVKMTVFDTTNIKIKPIKKVGKTTKKSKKAPEAFEAVKTFNNVYFAEPVIKSLIEQAENFVYKPVKKTVSKPVVETIFEPAIDVVPEPVMLEQPLDVVFDEPAIEVIPEPVMLEQPVDVIPEPVDVVPEPVMLEQPLDVVFDEPAIDVIPEPIIMTVSEPVMLEQPVDVVIIDEPMEFIDKPAFVNKPVFDSECSTDDDSLSEIAGEYVDLLIATVDVKHREIQQTTEVKVEQTNPFDVEELTVEQIVEILNKVLFDTPSDLKLQKFYEYSIDEREVIVKYCNPDQIAELKKLYKEYIEDLKYTDELPYPKFESKYLNVIKQQYRGTKLNFIENPTEQMEDIDYSTDKNMVSTDYNDLYQCLDQISDKFMENSEICNDVIIKGKTGNSKVSRTSEANRKVNAKIALSKFIQSKGFTKTKVGDFIQYSKKYSLEPLAKYIAQKAVVTGMVNFDRPDLSKEDRNDLIKRTYAQYNSRQRIDQRQLNILCDQAVSKLTKFKNFQLKFEAKDISPSGTTKFTGDTLQELTEKLVEFYTRYMRKLPEESSADYSMKVREARKYVEKSVGTLKASFINCDINKLTKGSIIKEIVQDKWIVINPATKTHCVADCLSILELYRSEKDLLAVKSYIKSRGKEIAEKLDIKEGCPESKLKEISEAYNVDIVMGMDTDYEKLDKDAYLLIEDEHCYIILNPDNQRSHQVKDLLQRLYTERAKVMNTWSPKENVIAHFVAFDWEFFDEQPKRVPYGAGMYTKIGGKSVYDKTWGITDIAQKFIDNMANMCDKIYDYYEPKYRQSIIDQHEADNEELTDENLEEAISHMPLNIIFGAHNGFKADFPLIRKKLLEKDCKFVQTGQLASSMCQICYTFRYEDKVNVIIIDTLSHLQMSVEDMTKMFSLDCEKQDVNHDIINRETYEQQIIDQKLDYYLEMDCAVLYEAFTKYDQICQETDGFTLLQNSVWTTASFASKAFFNKDRWPTAGKAAKSTRGDAESTPLNIYQLTPQGSDHCKLAYKGGMTDTFAVGEFIYVQSLDINSSYPHQMTKAPLPVGKDFRVNINKRYTKGMKLLHGIYSIIVESTPKDTKMCILAIKEGGKNVFAKLYNYRLDVTLEEIEYAHICGYKMFIQYGTVTEQMGKPFDTFILTAYAKRKEIKAQMEQLQIQIDELSLDMELNKKAIKTLESEYSVLDCKQLLQKLKLNSLYGKFAWRAEHFVSQQITQDRDMLINMYKHGNLTSVKEINERYFSFSGIQVSSESRSNFMLASYITARARIQLHQGLVAVDKAGFQPLYGDTDSIYFAPKVGMIPEDFIYDPKTQKLTPELEKGYKTYIEPLIGKQLGAFKPEMGENVNEKFAVGAFCGLKLYAVRSMFLTETGDQVPTEEEYEQGYIERTAGKHVYRYKVSREDTLQTVKKYKEKICGRGILKWMVESSDAFNKERCEREGSDVVNYNTIRSLLTPGNYIKITRKQATVLNSMLTVKEDDTSDSNIVSVKSVTSKITAQITKKKPNELGICNCLTINGQDYVPIVEEEANTDKYIEFPTFDSIEQHYGMDIQDVFDKYCTLQREADRKFLVFQDNDYLEEFLAENNQNGQFHQMFGEWVVPSIDIDLKDDEKPVLGVCEDIEVVAVKFQHMLLGDKHENVVQMAKKDRLYSIVNRCRKGKISYHIRLPGYLVQRRVLEKKVQGFMYACEEYAKPLLGAFCDLGIYRRNGSLRLTDNNAYYKAELPQIHLVTPQGYAAMLEQQEKNSRYNITGAGLIDIKRKAEQFLREKKLVWEFRAARAYDNATFVYLNRTAKSDSKCCVCSGQHDKDNYLALKMTQTSINLFCVKQRQELQVGKMREDAIKHKEEISAKQLEKEAQKQAKIAEKEKALADKKASKEYKADQKKKDAELKKISKSLQNKTK